MLEALGGNAVNVDRHGFVKISTLVTPMTWGTAMKDCMKLHAQSEESNPYEED